MLPSQLAQHPCDDATPGRAGTRSIGSRALNTALVFAVTAAPLAAQDRLVRTFGPEDGLTTPVWGLAQDSAGFLWIGTEGGLFRFDGTEFRRWAADSIRGAVHGITVAPDGRIAALEQNGRVFEITASGARGISPRVNPLRDYNPLAYDSRGVLWLVDGSFVRYRSGDGDWQTIPAESFDGEQLRYVKSNRAGAIDVLTERSLWRIYPDSAPRRWFSGGTSDVVSTEDGRNMVLIANEVVHLSPTGERESSVHLSPFTRDIALAERHGTVWVARDRYLVAVRPGEAPEVDTFKGRVTFGGPLLVDREGSLWMGSNALHLFPEPESRIWRVDSELKLQSPRHIEKSGAAIWVGTWGNLLYIRHSASGSHVGMTHMPTLGTMCTDSSGVTWAAYGPQNAILELRDTTVIRHPFDLRRRGLHGCAPARAGGVWLATDLEVFNVSPGASAIRVVPSPPAPEGPIPRWPALHDSQNRLWVGLGSGAICNASVPRLRADATDAWSCDSVPGLNWLTGLIELPSGALWASSAKRGLLAYGPAGWQPLPMEDLPTRTVFALVPSRAGGVWIAGHGILQRVEEQPDGRTEVVERLTQWHGIPDEGGLDVVEEDDGAVWIVYEGITRVPVGARFAAKPPPVVALVDVSIDGAPIARHGPLELPHYRNRVELRFAALSFRNPSELRHQVRLGPDEPWSESRGNPSFRWVDLRAGDYQVEYRASLDGHNWSNEPVSFAFTVLAPWYATWWAIALGLLLVVGFAWVIYRARVAYLLGLERQRTRIAMDLHDEIGSGLASVGILSGVLAADSLEVDERRRTAGDIATAAEELGNALSDIVWSLDPHTATLEELASRLVEHSERLCATGDILLTTRLPASWPADRLDVSIRRNVLLVGLEALHNSVRHARAGEVLLSLMPSDGRWELSVRDNGLGLPNSRPKSGRGGHGLRGMRRRAEEIGAQLTVRSSPDEGTTITLRFRLRPSRLLRNGALGGRVRRLFTARLA